LSYRGIIPWGLSVLLEIAHLHERAAGTTLPLDSSPDLPAPRLALERPGKSGEFWSSLMALLRGPAAPEEFAGGPYFRDCWVDPRFPRPAFLAAIAIQALLMAYPPPIWNIRPTGTLFAAPQAEIAWYGPVNDFPALLPAVLAPKDPAPKPRAAAQPGRGADAFHPRQTILSEPLHPTHPRQTLLQPNAPQEPPKILPALPNIVQLAEAHPQRPKLQLTAAELNSLRPKVPAAVAASPDAAPEIAALEKQPGAISIASSPRAPAKPLLPVNPMSAPRATAQRAETNAAAPDVGGSSGASETLIALSATPSPAPPPSIPAGNLAARVSISPEGPQPGAPGGAPAGAKGASAASGGGRGPEGIFISGGSGASASPVSGVGSGAASHGDGERLTARPLPRARPALEASKSLAADAEDAAAAPKLGMTPQQVLGAKRVYTMHVNMPNLTSASGSWILNFAELDDAAPDASVDGATLDLSGPVALRKVDPKYPPELRTLHVDGEVLLYAIIRKDGSVDSIQLVHSVDPLLDANAMEALAQWKFRPAERQGQPVDLEAVVHIPFRSRGPAF
jgi:TonB family protein